MSRLSGTLRQVSLSVDDVDAAVAFYRDVLELPLLAQFGPVAFFDLGGTRLLLTRPEGAPPASSILYFAVDDLPGTRARLEDRGVRFVDEPHQIFDDVDGTFGEPNHAEWMTFFEDPEGHLLALAARVPSG